jgi:hypothetical protein
MGCFEAILAARPSDFESAAIFPASISQRLSTPRRSTVVSSPVLFTGLLV